MLDTALRASAELMSRSERLEAPLQAPGGPPYERLEAPLSALPSWWAADPSSGCCFRAAGKRTVWARRVLTARRLTNRTSCLIRGVEVSWGLAFQIM